MEYILQIQNLSKSFAIHKGQGRARGQDTVPVVKDVTMNIKRGSITALIGGNGAGKTTLFNLINGLLKVDSGLITYHDDQQGHDLVHLSTHEIARLGIGRLFQGTRIFEKLSVLENLLLYLGDYPSEWPFSHVFSRKKLLKEFNSNKELILAKISGLLGKDHTFYQSWNKQAGTLSFADQRVLSLLGLMISDFKLILIDEPTSGINQDFLSQLREWILQLKGDDQTVFMIEHNMDFVRDTADVCHYMGAGKIQYSGTPAQVLENAEVQKEYLI